MLRQSLAVREVSVALLSCQPLRNPCLRTSHEPPPYTDNTPQGIAAGAYLAPTMTIRQVPSWKAAFPRNIPRRRRQRAAADGGGGGGPAANAATPPSPPPPPPPLPLAHVDRMCTSNFATHLHVQTASADFMSLARATNTNQTFFAPPPVHSSCQRARRTGVAGSGGIRYCELTSYHCSKKSHPPAKPCLQRIAPRTHCCIAIWNGAVLRKVHSPKHYGRVAVGCSLRVSTATAQHADQVWSCVEA